MSLEPGVSPFIPSKSPNSPASSTPSSPVVLTGGPIPMSATQQQRQRALRAARSHSVLVGPGSGNPSFAASGFANSNSTYPGSGAYAPSGAGQDSGVGPSSGGAGQIYGGTSQGYSGTGQGYGGSGQGYSGSGQGYSGSGQGYGATAHCSSQGYNAPAYSTGPGFPAGSTAPSRNPLPASPTRDYSSPSRAAPVSPTRASPSRAAAQPSPVRGSTSSIMSPPRGASLASPSRASALMTTPTKSAARDSSRLAAFNSPSRQELRTSPQRELRATVSHAMLRTNTPEPSGLRPGPARPAHHKTASVSALDFATASAGGSGGAFSGGGGIFSSAGVNSAGSGSGSGGALGAAFGTSPTTTSSNLRARAKITPAATPRRKTALPGAERADRPASVAVSSFAPSPFPPPTFSISAPTPRNRPAGRALPPDSLEFNPHEFSDAVRVCVRMRPPRAKRIDDGDDDDTATSWLVDEARASVTLDTAATNVTREFHFDDVVTEASNAFIYRQVGRNLVLSAMEGFDALLFAYGQTASGKTYTLSGTPQNPGIIMGAMVDVFAYMALHPEREFALRASYLEIYNERILDLLQPGGIAGNEPRIRMADRNGQKLFFVADLCEERVGSVEEIADLFRRGNANRTTGQTDFNEHSSRSHSVFQIVIESRSRADGSVRTGHLSIIDLAGSEQATSQLERRSEGASINKSLLCLQKVICSLTDKKGTFVPFRETLLTKLIQPYLIGNAKITVIATINPSPSAVEESRSTLKFAQSIKRVRVQANVNEVEDASSVIAEYERRIQELEQTLEDTKAAQAADGADALRQTEGDRHQSHNTENGSLDLSELRDILEGMKADADKQLLDKCQRLENDYSRLQEEHLLLVQRHAELARQINGSSKSAPVKAVLGERTNTLDQEDAGVDVGGELDFIQKQYDNSTSKLQSRNRSLEKQLSAEKEKMRRLEGYLLKHLGMSSDIAKSATPTIPSSFTFGRLSDIPLLLSEAPPPGLNARMSDVALWNDL